MHTISSAVKRHRLVTFFGLNYAISYGFYALSAFVPSFPSLFPFGPVLAEVITAGGRAAAALPALARGAALVRSGAACAHWHGPFCRGAEYAAGRTAARLGPTRPLVQPAAAHPIAMIDAPLQENSGWHGYAMPRFPAEHSPLVNTLIFGLLLAGWHAPLTLAEPSLIALYLLTTILSQVVTNWVYYNARQSALLAILYHSAANAVGLAYTHTLAGPDLTRYFWLLLAANALVGVAVVLFDRKTWWSRQPMASASAEALPSAS